jgi:hypothetical protein
MKEIPLGVIWVCECCLFARESEGCQHHDCDREPWSLIADDDSITSVTIGMLSIDHDCVDDNGRAEECDCEVRKFSRSSCDGCGNPLDGPRQAYTIWSAATVPA